MNSLRLRGGGGGGPRQIILGVPDLSFGHHR